MYAADELEGMRATALEAMPTTADVLARSVVADGTGGKVTTWAARDTELAARLGNPQGAELDLAERLSTKRSYLLTLPWGTTLEGTDHVATGGVEYEVLALLESPVTGTTVRALVNRTGS